MESNSFVQTSMAIPQINVYKICFIPDVCWSSLICLFGWMGFASSISGSSSSSFDSSLWPDSSPSSSPSSSDDEFPLATLSTSLFAFPYKTNELAFITYYSYKQHRSVN